MTLTDYFSQGERLAPGTVILKEGEYQALVTGAHHPSHFRQYSGLIVNIHMVPGYGYFVPEGETILYTIDDHGNKKSPSVFRLESPVNLIAAQLPVEIVQPASQHLPH